MAASISLDLRIDWSDQDVFGHVNNVAIMRFVQSGRVALWEATGTLRRFETGGVGPILAATSCRFLLPLSYPGSVRVTTTVSSLKNTSFRLTHQLSRPDGTLGAEADDVVVMYDFRRRTKTPIAPDLRIELQRAASLTPVRVPPGSG